MQSYVFDALLNYCRYTQKNNIRYKLKFLISSGNKHGGYKEGRLYLFFFYMMTKSTLRDPIIST